MVVSHPGRQPGIRAPKLSIWALQALDIHKWASVTRITGLDLEFVPDQPAPARLDSPALQPLDSSSEGFCQQLNYHQLCAYAKLPAVFIRLPHAFGQCRGLVGVATGSVIHRLGSCSPQSGLRCAASNESRTLGRGSPGLPGGEAGLLDPPALQPFCPFLLGVSHPDPPVWAWSHTLDSPALQPLMQPPFAGHVQAWVSAFSFGDWFLQLHLTPCWLPCIQTCPEFQYSFAGFASSCAYVPPISLHTGFMEL